MNNPDRRKSMSIASKKLSNNDAVIKIVDECLLLIDDHQKSQFDSLGIVPTEDVVSEINISYEYEKRNSKECSVA